MSVEPAARLALSETGQARRCADEAFRAAEELRAAGCHPTLIAAAFCTLGVSLYRERLSVDDLDFVALHITAMLLNGVSEP